MSARTSGAKRAAFLRALRETGNQSLAAEQPGVSRSTVRNLRLADPAFDAQCRSAKAESARRLAAGGCNRPPPGWQKRGAVELVVQRTAKGPPQVVRNLRTQWTPRAEDRFLGRLRTCNNVRLACRDAGMTVSSYEAHRRRWPDFRRRIEAARAFAGRRLAAAAEARRESPPDLRDAFEAADRIPDFPPGATIAERINLARRAKAEETMRRRRDQGETEPRRRGRSGARRD